MRWSANFEHRRGDFWPIVERGVGVLGQPLIAGAVPVGAAWGAFSGYAYTQAQPPAVGVGGVALLWGWTIASTVLGAIGLPLAGAFVLLVVGGFCAWIYVMTRNSWPGWGLSIAGGVAFGTQTDAPFTKGFAIALGILVGATVSGYLRAPSKDEGETANYRGSAT